MEQQIIRRRSLRLALSTSALLVAITATACGGTPAATPTAARGTSTSSATPTATATATPTGPAITMTDVWARATPGLPDENSAVYAVLQNKLAKADRVVSASVPESVAKRVELHTTVQESGVMKMVQVEGYDIPASGTFKLEPGGNHIMLLSIARQLKPGDTFTVSLKLQSGATVESKVEVKAMPGAAMPGAATPGGMAPSGSAGGMR